MSFDGINGILGAGRRETATSREKRRNQQLIGSNQGKTEQRAGFLQKLFHQYSSILWSRLMQSGRMGIVLRGLKPQFVRGGRFADLSIPERFRSGELVLLVLANSPQTAFPTSAGLLRRNPLRTVKTISIVSEVQPSSFRICRKSRLILKNSLMIRFILFLLTAPLSWP